MPASPDAYFKSFLGKIISYGVATSMISNIVSTMHIISNKSLQYGGFSYDRFIHFVLKYRRKAKIKIKLTDNSRIFLTSIQLSHVNSSHLF